MTWMLAEGYVSMPLSVYKPLLFTLVLGGWAWIASHLDKDAALHYLPRRVWNGGQMAAGALGFGLWLLIPSFWGGFFVALLFAYGTIGAYVWYRNQHVSEDDKWTLNLESFKQRMTQSQAQQAQRRALVTFLAKNGTPLDIPPAEDPRAQAHTLLDTIMEYALPRSAERVEFTITAQEVTLLVHIDGVRYTQERVDPALAVALMDYLKALANLDVQDRRKRQQAKMQFNAKEFGKKSLVLVTSGNTRELLMSWQIDPESRVVHGIDQLGLLPAQKQALDPVLGQRGGIVIATATAGQGQTTTLHNLVTTHDPYIQSIMTLEDRIANELEGVTHNLIDAQGGGTWLANRIGSMIRQDVHVIMVGRVDDGQVAQVIADSAGDARFYLGMREADTFGALRAWIKATGDPSLAAGPLQAVVASRMVRKLCTTCRIAYTPDPAALKKLNLPADRVGTLFKHSGQVMVKNKPETCPACQGIGYRGRLAVFEVMVLDDAARKLIASGEIEPLRSHLRKQRMLYLQEAALAKVVEGVTSIQEIGRALGKDADRPVPPPVPAAAASE